MTHVSSLYLHVPFCRHLCNYCDFYKRKYEPGSTQFEDFHQFLLASQEKHDGLMHEKGFTWKPLETIYLGGGTPSLWGTAGAEFFKKHFGQNKFAEAMEFTMEVDPATWTHEMISSWKEIGLNRISIGTQTLDPQFLKIMDRDHSVEDSRELLQYCHDHDWNFSLDFLLGLPFSREKKRNIKAELDEFLSYGPKHVSLYILNARSKYPHTQSMPDDEFIREEYLFVSDYLRQHGFHHYEVSNFALPGFESRHNLKYWHSQSVAAFGPTGTGFLRLNQQEGFRYKWKVSTADFEPEQLTEKEMALEEVYLELRLSSGWQPRELTDKHRKIFSLWEERNYGAYHDEKMQLNALGFLMLDSLMDDLFRENI